MKKIKNERTKKSKKKQVFKSFNLKCKKIVHSAFKFKVETITCF